MGLGFGSTTNVTRFYMDGVSELKDGELRNMLKPLVISPLTVGDTDSRSVGVCTPGGSPDLDSCTLLCGDYYYFGFRVDSKKVDSGALKRATREAIESAQEKGTVTRSMKNAIKESVIDGMMRSAFPSTKVYGVVVDLRNGMAYADCPYGHALYELLLVLGKATKCHLVYSHNADAQDGCVLNPNRVKELGKTLITGSPVKPLANWLTVSASQYLKCEFKSTKELFPFSVESAAFVGSQKKCTVTDECMAANKAFVGAFSSQMLLKKLAIRFVSDVLEWVATVDSAGAVRIKMPKVEAAEADDLLVKRMEIIEAVFFELDSSYFLYYASK